MSQTESDVYALVLGRVVASLRERRGMNQGQLAAKIGMAQSSLSRIESGQNLPDAYVFRRIAQALGMTVGDLQRRVDNAMQRTQQAALGAAPGGGGDVPWWQVALGIAGIVGLTGLIVFAVAAALSDDKEEEG